jgi:hypothetical protein
MNLLLGQLFNLLATNVLAIVLQSLDSLTMEMQLGRINPGPSLLGSSFLQLLHK